MKKASSAAGSIYFFVFDSFILLLRTAEAVPGGSSRFSIFTGLTQACVGATKSFRSTSFRADENPDMIESLA